MQIQDDKAEGLKFRRGDEKKGKQQSESHKMSFNTYFKGRYLKINCILFVMRFRWNEVHI